MEDKTLLLKILDKLETLEFLIPQWISLTELCTNMNIKSNTARSYLVSNYVPNKDFKKIGGKLYVVRDVALSIRRHYAK